MSNKRKVYLLDPQELPPETIAVTFAKTSRSPESFRQIAAELSDEKSSQFHGNVRFGLILWREICFG